MRVRSVVTNASCLAFSGVLMFAITMSVEQDFTAIIMIQSGYGTEKCRFPRAVPANKGQSAVLFLKEASTLSRSLFSA